VFLTSFVMRASTPSTCTEEEGGGYLHDALFGTKISNRSDGDSDTAITRLDAILKGLLHVLKRELGDNEATDQAILEMSRVIKLPLTEYMAVQAKRAVVLYALWQERDVQEHFRMRGEAALVDDLCKRVLPMIMPKFVANQCQGPDAAVISTMIMHKMWAAEDIGAVQPCLHLPAGQHDDRTYGERA